MIVVLFIGVLAGSVAIALIGEYLALRLLLRIIIR